MRDARTDYYYRKVRRQMSEDKPENPNKPQDSPEPPKGPPNRIEPHGIVDAPGRQDPPPPPPDPPGEGG
jgi:hypothetical protein